MTLISRSAVGAAAAALVATCVSSWGAFAADPDVERGKYLVNIAGCNDCHTPGYFLGKPDMARFLGGSEVGFEIPGLGVFHGPNLTPDKETGLGGWTDAQILAALQKGTTPTGRMLAPIMPWHAFASLGMSLGPAVGGWIFDTFGTYGWLYLGSLAMGLAAAGIALAFPPLPSRLQKAAQPA